MRGSAHMSIGMALGLVTHAAVEDGSLALAMVIGAISAGIPDLDSDTPEVRDVALVSWKSIKSDARRSVRGAVRAMSRPSAAPGAVFDLLVTMVLLVPRLAVAALLDLTARLLPHRGVTHWGLTWLLLSALAFLLAYGMGWPIAYPLAFSAGYLSHILGDGLTVSGVPLWYPFAKTRFRFLPRWLSLRWDSPVQWLVVLAVWGTALAVAWPGIADLLEVHP